MVQARSIHKLRVKMDTTSKDQSVVVGKDGNINVTLEYVGYDGNTLFHLRGL